MTDTFAPFNMDFSKYFGEFKLPQFDMEGFLASQKKSMETLTEANRKAAESLQAIIKRNTEIMQATMTEAAEMLNSIAAEGTPEDKVVKQADLMKSAFEKSLANIKEIGSMLVESNTEYADTITARITEVIAEMKDVAEKSKAA